MSLRLCLTVVVGRAVRQLAVNVIVIAEYNFRNLRVELQIAGECLI